MLLCIALGDIYIYCLVFFFFLTLVFQHALCIYVYIMQAAAATSSDYHSVNGQRKPFRRNNSTSSSNPHPNADQNHTQRSGAATTQSRNPHHRHHRNGSSSYPGNRQRNFEHGHSNGRGDMHLQPQRGVGTMRPQMLMGPPSSAQYMAAAPQIGSYGGPMLYPAGICSFLLMPSISIICMFYFLML